VLLFSTTPFFSVMLERSVSITIRTAVIAPDRRSAAPSSSVSPFWSASTFTLRFGVARVMNPLAEPAVSGDTEAETLTMNRSTRATR
jgi:hypothetical protein